jgi:RNA polymerase sigma factor (sigma-70 family)
MHWLRRSELGDDALVERVRGGDTRSFDVLFERYGQSICNFVAMRVADRAAAEDVTQEIFIAALRGIRSTQNEINFKSWVYEIARNACIDQYRRTQRSGISVPLTDEQAHNSSSQLGQPERDFEVSERFTELCEAIRELPGVQRDLLVLREFGGLSYAEIAEKEATTVPAVETALHRARRRLELHMGVRPAAASARKRQRAAA